jgi:hypothetical protein
MYPTGQEYLEVVETSEWFDWMRTEIVEGGLNLPSSETSTLFAAKALHLASRIQSIYKHLPAPLKLSLVKAAIVYQCWEWENRIQKQAKWPGARNRGALRSLEGVRYIRKLGEGPDHHLVEANDGSEYVVTVSTTHGYCGTTMAATEILCNELARMLGLRVAGAAVIKLSPALLISASKGNTGWTRRCRDSELCCGFNHVAAAKGSSDATVPDVRCSGRDSRQLVGALVLDIWTLNLSPRAWVWAVSQTTGRFEATFVNDSQCLMGSDWGNFLKADSKSLPGPQGIAARVKGWKQIDPWLSRIDSMNLNRLWELAFQMPSQWYAGDRRVLCALLDKLSQRQWDLRKAIYHFITVGYLVNLDDPRKALWRPGDSEPKDPAHHLDTPLPLGPTVEPANLLANESSDVEMARGPYSS